MIPQKGLDVHTFLSHGAQFSYLRLDEAGADAPLIVWAHGWGQNHAAFLPLAETLRKIGTHVLIDLPGHGESPPPPETWGTEDYADAIAGWMKDQNFPPVIWVGHSFGCRVGIRLAAQYPERVKAMCLIAAAGLKRKRPPHTRLYFFLRIKLFKALKAFLPQGETREKILGKFGSADYKNAGPMRSVFIRTVNEDLSETAKGVKCPVRLVFGTQDTETPPEFGTRYKTLMPGAEFLLLDGLDHYSVLGAGRHQAVKVISDLVKGAG